jgi:hypothetical protein
MSIADRREFLAYFSSIGLGSTLLPGVLWERLRSGAEITAESIASAAEIAGVELEAEEREMMVQALRGQARQLAALHEIPLHHQVAPAIVFNPLPRGFQPPLDNRPFRPSRPEAGTAAPDDETLAFMPVHKLAGLVRSGAVTSERLTRLSLERIAGGTRTLAGPRRRSGDRGRPLPRTSAWHPVGCEGPAGSGRCADHLGSGAVQGAADGHGHRRQAAGRGRSRARREAHPR